MAVRLDRSHAVGMRKLLLGLAVALALIVIVPLSPTSTAQAAGYTTSQLRDRANTIMFSKSLASFHELRNDTTRSAIDQKFDWGSNGCSVPGWTLPITAYWSAFFSKACDRHDFGYRNYGHPTSMHAALGSDEDYKYRIDKRLLSDMQGRCTRYRPTSSCYSAAASFYGALRASGTSYTNFYKGYCPSGRFCLFDDSSYGDRRKALSSSEDDMNDIGFGDKTSAVKNRTSVAWVIYDDHDYDDRRICLRAGAQVSRLSDYDFNDKTSSAKRLSSDSCP